MAEAPFEIDSFPAPIQRGDRSDYGCVEDRNAIRGPESNAIKQRPGTRVWTCSTLTTPTSCPNPPTNSTLGGSDTLHMVKWTGGQPILTTTTNQNCPNGPRIGTMLILALVPFGGVLAVPGAGAQETAGGFTDAEPTAPNFSPPSVLFMFASQVAENALPFFTANTGAFPSITYYDGVRA